MNQIILIRTPELETFPHDAAAHIEGIVNFILKEYRCARFVPRSMRVRAAGAVQVRLLFCERYRQLVPALLPRVTIDHLKAVYAVIKYGVVAAKRVRMYD